MSENEPTFEVRERRRFTDADSTPAADAGAETGDAAADAPAGSASAGAEEGVTGQPSDAAGTQGETVDAESEAASDAGEQEDEFGGGGLPDIPTPAMLQFMMANLAQMAWQNMGLIPNASTGKIEPRLPDARLAIDAFAALLPVLSPRLDEEARKEMQNVLSNLRLNYVEQSKRQQGS